ncbi:hypothetical protein [uncultured Roseobacter sp.]|uniref:hypothetical protein n=1 Tax=uncultured Roseobacter sp. TaxID=114847 RepID=UPI00261E6F51|nr:hypothetical protein [uncultured Roseobacter sp.]
MNILQISLPILLFIWAGVSLSGNLVAASAKFQVEALTMPVALQVGRAQFTWIGYVEWSLFAVVILSVLVRSKVLSVALGIALLIFLVQQLWMQPLLEARTNIIVSGGDAGDSHFHIYFIVAEVMKFLALIWAGCLALSIFGNSDTAKPDG